MIQIKGNDIIISQNDTFNVTFRLTGFEIAKTDTIIFTVKNELFDQEVLLEKQFSNISGSDINIIITAEEMKKIPLGINYYDLLCLSSGTKTTLNFPSKLIVQKVVHNDK